jgi:hypothetical protein
MFQLLLYIFITCSIIIIALITSHNVIIIPDFNSPRVRAVYVLVGEKSKINKRLPDIAPFKSAFADSCKHLYSHQCMILVK